jgi:intracellular septation protein A
MSTDTRPQGNGFDRNRLRSLAPTVLFDVGGPLALYWLLRLAGTSDVTALIVSGILPAFRVAHGIIRRRRVDAIGLLVLFGIVVGTILGLVSHSARLMLLEGSVPTAVFGLVCLGSLLTSKPMLLRVALQTNAGTQRGREIAARAEHPSGRRAFRIITLTWGIALLAEAVTRIGIVETMSTGTALLASKVMPLLVIAALLRWTMYYARRAINQGEAWAAEGEPAVTAQQLNAGARPCTPVLVGTTSHASGAGRQPVGAGLMP